MGSRKPLLSVRFVDSFGGLSLFDIAYLAVLLLARHRDVADCGDTLAQFGHFAVDQLGTPYDNQMIAKIAARITMTHLLDADERAAQIQDWQAAGLERNQAYICSELVWECYQRLGIEIPHDPLGFVAPKDLAADPKIECLGVLS